MSLAYQYDASRYYAGTIEDYGLLPHNATYTKAVLQDGFWPRWNGSTWDQVENHKDETGYVDGKPHTIKEYGPRPDGWSTTPPEKTQAEKDAERRVAVLDRLRVIDADSVRPLRAIAQGDATQGDKDKLAALDAEAAELRAELATLPVASAEA